MMKKYATPNIAMDQLRQTAETMRKRRGMHAIARRL